MTLHQLVIEEGAALAVGNNHPLVLNDPAVLWFVETGAVDVFGVPMSDGEISGTRTHLVRLDPGECFFALHAPDLGNQTEFIAAGATGTQVRVLPIARLETLADSEAVAQFAQSLDACIAALYSTMNRELLPKQFVTLQPGQNISLEAAAIARPANGVVWVRPHGAATRMAGIQDLTLAPGFFTPVTAHGWIEAVEKTSIDIGATADLLAQRTLGQGLEQCRQAINRWARFNADRTLQTERHRLEKKSDLEQHSLRAAAAGLLSMFEVSRTKTPAVVSTDNSVYGACQVLGTHLGVTFAAPSAASEQGKDALLMLMAASRVRSRRVLLTGNWWQQDNGSLLGYLEGSNRAVALLPISNAAYEMVDPIEHTRATVTDESAAKIAPVAFMFYRSFPDRALKVWDVVRLGLRGTFKDIVTIALIGMVGGALSMLTPIATGLVMDSIIPSGERSQLFDMTVGLFIVAVAGLLFEITRGVALVRVETQSNTSIQAAVWDRLLRLPIPFFKQFSSGDLALRANSINEIRERLSQVVMTSVLSGVFSFYSFGLLFYYSGKLALLATGLVLVSISCTMTASLFSIRFTRARFAIQGKISGFVLQLITGISKLRVAGAEGQAYTLWAHRFAEEKQAHLRAAAIGNGLKVFNAVFPTLSTMALFATMAFWLQGKMSTGGFLAFNAAWGSFLAAMLSMASSVLSTLEIIPIYERAKPILEAVPEVDTTKADPGPLSGRVELSHIHFRYDPNGPLILNDVSLQIAPGEFVALVGPSGSGKSTLFRLLLGFEFAESGTIYFDGMDLATLDVQAVRKQFGVVLQNGALMPGSIFENIIGNSNLRLDDAWDAARKAGLAEDIEAMPMGMHTMVSEGATTLSGGQRQRLMIARAIVHRPRLILFDEATSALDNRTQAIVSRSLEQLQATRIVIAHRLSTIQQADKIFVLQNGRLVQSGTYETLVNQPGVFADLATRQIA